MSTITSPVTGRDEQHPEAARCPFSGAVLPADAQPAAPAAEAPATPLREVPWVRPDSSVPASDVDLFSDAHRQDPYPDYDVIRETGPAVHMTRYGAAALARHAQVRQAAEDWETFSSAQGIALNENLNAAIRDHAVVATDPPYHDALRAVLNARLAPRQVRKLTGDVNARVEPLVDAMVAKREFDIINDCAYQLVPQFVLDQFGFPEEGSEHLVEWAEQIFQVFAPEDDPKAAASVSGIENMFGWLATQCTRDRVAPGGFADDLYRAAERGDIQHESVVTMMTQYAIPGIDTTIGLLGNVVELFAKNPDQWDIVRADPDAMIRPALTEALRMETPVQWFSRVLTREWETEGVTLAEGTRVMLLYAAANRDPRVFADPNRFDVTRNPMEHLAFGAGIHGCPGQHMALLQVSRMLQAFIDRGVTRFELTGTPQRTLNNTTRAFLNVPVRVTVA